MVSSRMTKAGYSYINIDDGYFGGRDEKNQPLTNLERFPNGMKVVSLCIKATLAGKSIFSTNA